LKKIKVGSRQSILALEQTKEVIRKLKENHEDLDFEIVPIITKGDRILDKTLSKVGGKGLFVKEIEKALLLGEIDLAVHSLKDLPYEICKGLKISAITSREDARDVYISRSKEDFFATRVGAKIGTSSLRRTFLIKKLRPDIEIIPIRGNIKTRVRKFYELDLDGIILAAAGLIRLGMEGMISTYFPLDKVIPAVGQGALAVEIREDDKTMMQITSSINCDKTAIAVQAERSFMRELGGSCKVPIGAYGKIEKDILELIGMVGIDGNIRNGSISGKIDKAKELGKALARELREEK